MKSQDQISKGTVYGIALCQRFLLAANKGPVADTELPRRTREKASGTQGAGYVIKPVKPAILWHNKRKIYKIKTRSNRSLGECVRYVC